jgi:hypothetical protein
LFSAYSADLLPAGTIMVMASQSLQAGAEQGQSPFVRQVRGARLGRFNSENLDLMLRSVEAFIIVCIDFISDKTAIRAPT